jgi:uncharacterized membrane-anchored protein YitT (DUF2179 family)
MESWHVAIDCAVIIVANVAIGIVIGIGIGIVVTAGSSSDE